jgi:tetratricopeptide (TPR) repeat protein
MKNKLLEILKSGQYARLFKLIGELLPQIPIELKDNFTLFTAQFNKNENDFKLGQLTSDQYRVNEVRITAGLLDLINQLPDNLVSLMTSGIYAEAHEDTYQQTEHEQKTKILEEERNKQAQKISELYERNARALDNINRKDEEIRTLRQQLTKAQNPEEIRLLEAQIQTLQSEKEVLEKQINDLQSQLAEAWRQQDNLVSQIQDLEAKLTFAEKQLEELRQKYKEIDFSQNSDAYKQAYELLLEGKTAEADQVLNHAYLEEKEQKLRQQTKEQYRSLAREYVLKAQIAVQSFDFTQAEQSYQKATELCPDAEFWFEYAYFLQDINQFTRATSYYQRALIQYRRENNLPNIAKTLNNLGELFRIQNDFQKSEFILNKSLQIYRNLAQNAPNVYLPNVATTLNNIANSQKIQNQLEKALAGYQEALQIYKQFAQNSPSIYLSYVAITLNNLANLQKLQNQAKKALAGYQEALQIYKQFAQNSPSIYLSYVAGTLNNLGELYRSQRSFQQSESTLTEALQIYKALAQNNSNTYLPKVAMTLNNLAVLYSTKSEFKQALPKYEEALKIYRAVVVYSPKTYLPYVAGILHNLGKLHFYQNKFITAEINYQEALQIRRALAQTNPSAFDLDYCGTALSLSTLYQSLVQKGSLQYVGHANVLLEDAAVRLSRYPHVPKAQWHIEKQLIPLRQFFAQYGRA